MAVGEWELIGVIFHIHFTYPKDGLVKIEETSQIGEVLISLEKMLTNAGK